MTFHFDNSWLRDLPGTFLRQNPETAPAPKLVILNRQLADDLGLDSEELVQNGAAWFSGAALPPGADPAALAYAGHQFGYFSEVLGDGRALLLGEFTDRQGRRWDLQLKGSGRTPFARFGDGKAVLGPMLREYLVSEAMAALNVPTTRSLAVATTGEIVPRDGRPEPSAVLARIAASHIRIGSFQYFAARRELDKLRALADYTMARHDPDLAAGDYLGFFDRVITRQARLIAQWMGLGFIHGVMNTDNMAISGETIDYGPCAFMERFAPGTVFSSIDRQGRYSWANQPLILGWNLAKFAETLVPLIDLAPELAVEALNHLLSGIKDRYRAEWLGIMRVKLGLTEQEAGDDALIEDLLAAMTGADWTLTFYQLATAIKDTDQLKALFDDFSEMAAWLKRWRGRNPDPEIMRRANPAVVPRNLMVNEALEAARMGDMQPFHSLLAAVQRPFVEQADYMQPAPADAPPFVTYCGT